MPHAPARPTPSPPVTPGSTAPASAPAPGPITAPPLKMDDLPGFLRFTPAPVKARRDGWGEEVQLRFILHLACGASVSAAARGVGRSRSTAYMLYAKAGAESFARAWDTALAFARVARMAAASRAANRAGRAPGRETPR
ncbi:MAG TPA: hypothetical protein VEZ20_00785 [Allosphingosinicella sp.]|nr:hypothetical protein [Allosphingosinicella sp.]